MELKFLIDEDIVNYKKCSMFLGFPSCTWKCEKECGINGICQNTDLAKTKSVDIDVNTLIQRYIDNNLTSAIVCGGLEPFDSFNSLYELIKTLRLDYNCNDDIVIYTGYKENENEIINKISQITIFKNIIIKFGRFIPNSKSHFDEILGIELASDNQYAKLYTHDGLKISLNPDENIVKSIKEKLSNNDGFCPCRLNKIDENKCMCQEFKNTNTECECHCGLYLKV